ncbi:hypothetical protein [Chelatococcus asaccharovorans]|uniref:Uncharacterized protein n=1 Tax=Chelatococcus asaccharovorans TaxID=28210 RepID=A0A2V3TRK0_9HYPH|nr:hypothetical protein [Chelatococcus asaccharovorans]MBS7707909.1 hypothetical protein [Chelatococcus asaccharovorans]PXW51159.1 hypothetical protein C7450_12150 [Chelatococcus asaccharovorans]
MKRALIFLFVGPIVSFLLVLGTAMAFGVKAWEPAVLGVMFDHSCEMGIVPAVLAGLIDWRLAARTTFAWRILQTAGAAFIISALIGLFLLRHDVGAVLIFAIYAAIAAVICSRLSGGSKELPKVRSGLRSIEMKRALIFLIVGPAVGFLLALGTAIVIGVRPWEPPMFLGVMFAYSYKVGLIPAALTGLVDSRLAAITTFAGRIIQTAGTGFVISALVGLFLFSLGGGAVLIYAIYGTIAATVCSWLSGRSKGAADAQ